MGRGGGGGAQEWEDKEHLTEWLQKW